MLFVFVDRVEASEKPIVLSSIRPLALIVDAVAGDLVTSEVLLSASDSPHHLALRVSQIEKLQRANLVIWVGPEFERFLSKPLEHQSKQLALSDLFSDQHAGAIRPADEHELKHGHGEQHLWLDPHYIRALAEALSLRLQALMPERAAQLKQQALAFVQEMEQLERNTYVQLSKLHGGFFVYHPALEGYVNTYKLNQIASVLEGSETSPSVKRIASLKKQAAGAQCLLADKQELVAAKRYAKLLNLPLRDLDVLAANDELRTWFAYYQNFADAISKCLLPGK